MEQGPSLGTDPGRTQPWVSQLGKSMESIRERCSFLWLVSRAQAGFHLPGVPCPAVPHTACTTFSNCCVGSQIGLGSCWFKQVFFSIRSPWANMLHFELPRGECGIFCDGPQNSFFCRTTFLRIQVEKNWTTLSVPVLVSLRLCSHLRYFIPFLSLNKNWSPHYHHHQHHHTISKLHLQLSILAPVLYYPGLFLWGAYQDMSQNPALSELCKPEHLRTLFLRGSCHHHSKRHIMSKSVLMMLNVQIK